MLPFVIGEDPIVLYIDSDEIAHVLFVFLKSDRTTYNNCFNNVNYRRG